uniref:Uncharacterized protein n=1 Tax=Anguilla anguilla TaxID=7936 RepID=A0A0E9PR67_ANGAN
MLIHLSGFPFFLRSIRMCPVCIFFTVLFWRQNETGL